MAKLTELRKAAGMTQKALAEASGVNIMQISRSERGEIKVENISLKNAAAIAKVLGVHAEDLL